MNHTDLVSELNSLNNNLIFAWVLTYIAPAFLLHLLPFEIRKLQKVSHMSHLKE